MKRLLFVDDQPEILAALRRNMYRRRSEFECTFVTSGPEALVRLEQGDIDVIISDMRMPGMDGADLLQRVKERHPGIVRLVLSGYADQEMSLRVVSAAHQFLSKPSDADVLCAVVERACRLQQLLVEPRLRKAIGSIGRLPTLPATYIALNEVLANPQGSLKDVAKIVEGDVGLCAKLLQLANSAFFGLARRTTDVTSVVTYLGANVLKALVLSLDVVEKAEGAVLPKALSLQGLQAHAIATAGLARRMLSDRHQAEDAFAAGMLHDIGELVLAGAFVDDYAEVAASAIDGPQLVHMCERAAFGVSHAEVGAYLLSLWGLPFSVVDAVAYHHQPGLSNAAALDVVGAVHIADFITQELAAGDDLLRRADTVLDEAYIDKLGLSGRLAEWRELAVELGA